MRKILLSACFALAATWAAAQPVLTQAAVGAVGTTFYLGVQDTFPTMPNLGSPGPNQNWNFGSLLVNGTDTIWFVDPNTSTYAANFPGANLAVKQASLGGGVAFFESTASYFDLLGLAGDILNTGSPIVVHQTPPSRFAQFPFTYQNTFSNTTVIDVRIDASSFGIPFVDSARYKNIQARDNVADAYGTLTLPSGTFSNVLRVKEINAQKDSIWIHSLLGWNLYSDSAYTDSTFTWWDNSKGYYLAQAAYIGGALNDIRYEDPIILGAADPRSNAFKLYPNPANDRLFVETDGKTYGLRITDLLGRVIMEERVAGLHSEVYVGSLQRGCYVYSMLDKQGRVLQSGKLQLAR